MLIRIFRYSTVFHDTKPIRNTNTDSFTSLPITLPRQCPQQRHHCFQDSFALVLSLVSFILTTATAVRTHASRRPPSHRSSFPPQLQMASSPAHSSTAGCHATDDGSHPAKCTARYRPLILPEEMVVLATRQLERDMTRVSRASTLFQRGKAQLLLECEELALSDFAESLKLYSSPELTTGEITAALTQLYYYTGLCQARLGRFEVAVEAYNAALQLCPTFARALYERAASHNALGHFDLAIADYESALAHDREVGTADTHVPRSTGESTATRVSLPVPNTAPDRPRSRFASARERGQPIDTIYAELVKQRRENRVQALGACAATPAVDDLATHESAYSLTETVAVDVAGDGDATADMSCSSSTSSGRDPHRGHSAAHGMPMEPDEDNTAASAVDPADVLSRTSSMETMDELTSLSSDEDSAHVYYQRGLYHRRRGELTEAVDMYSAAIELDRNHLKAYFNRAFCHDKLGHFEAAVDDYTTALRLDPQNAYAWYNLGIVYDRQGQYARAIECFSRAIQLEPRNADFFHNRGYSRRKLGSYADAIEDYTQAISVDPQHFKSHYNRAFCHDKTGNFALAVEDYTAALAIDATNVGAYFNRGIAHERLHQEEAALSDYETATKLDPRAVFALNAYALLLDHFARYQEAEAVFSKAIELEPNSARLYHNRGYTYRNMGDLDKALQDYSAALDRDASLTAAFNNRAFVLRKLGRYAEAARDYSEVAEGCAEERLKALNNRAYCHARLEQYEDAIHDYTRVIALDRFNTHALHNRGISYDKAGYHKEAISDFTKCIQLAPDSSSSANAYYSRGMSYVALQQNAEAAQDLEMAMRLDVAAEMAKRGGDDAPAGAASTLRHAHPAYAVLRRLRGRGRKHRHHQRHHETAEAPTPSSKDVSHAKRHHIQL